MFEGSGHVRYYQAQIFVIRRVLAGVQSLGAKGTRSCGQLSQPQDDGGQCHNGEVVPCGLLEASCDPSELLEPGDAALDEVTLSVEVRIKRMFLGARGIVGNDGECALVGNSPADAVAIVGGVGHHRRGRQIFDQGQGLRGVTAVTGGEDEADRAAETSDGEVDLGAQTAA